LAGLLFGLIKWLVVLSVIFAVITFFDANHKLLSEELLSGSSLYLLIDRLNILHYLIEQLPDHINMPDIRVSLTYR
ncbi:MAG: hypothetical protein RG741_05190, partial [Bacteroidales bacterium]|nr:hypothetical protein [Bacteroidales bacterium]